MRRFLSSFARGTSHSPRVDAIPLRRRDAADRAGRGAVGDAGLAQRQVVAGARHERPRPVEADDAEVLVALRVEPALLLAGQDGAALSNASCSCSSAVSDILTTDPAAIPEHRGAAALSAPRRAASRPRLVRGRPRLVEGRRVSREPPASRRGLPAPVARPARRGPSASR